MGKDQDFLDAARNGNISYVEKVLNHRTKRSGPLASLRRGPGVNFQDSSGYSALHHACLNGHSDIVRLLLAHEVSPNLPDTRGSSPLHLAAWAGHQDIVKMLLIHPYRPANPNMQTVENETPLHCAAQHGHIGALSALLLQDADPNVRNSRNETPLDLAAQYGRLQAVQILIRAHPELLTPYYENNMNPNKLTYTHTCLHLASRNGHKSIVEMLLAAGVNVNMRTASGTALHEAALCGKESVVRTLLRAGIDLNCTDVEGRTALDILKEFPAHVTKGIIGVIKSEWRNSIDNDIQLQQLRKRQQQPYQSHQKRIHKSHHYLHFNSNNHLLNHSHSHSLQQQHYSGGGGSNNTYYKHGIHNDGKMLLECDVGVDIDSISNSQNDIATVSPSSSMSSYEPASVSPRSRSSTGCGGGGSVSVEIGHSIGNSAPPKKPPRRNLSISPTHNNALQQQNLNFNSPNHQQYQFNMRRKLPEMQQRSPSNDSTSYSPKIYTEESLDYDSASNAAMQKGTRKRAEQLQRHHIGQADPVSYEYIFLARSGGTTKGKVQGKNFTSLSNSELLDQRNLCVDQYVEMSLTQDNDGRECDYNAVIDDSQSTPTNRLIPALHNQTKLSSECVNPILKSYNPNRKLKRNRDSCSFGDNQCLSVTSSSEKSQLTQILPSSPTNYQQPPTPEHPPPSVNQAEHTIHERIRPLSLEYKRHSQCAAIEMVESTTSPPPSVTKFDHASCFELSISPGEYHHKLDTFTQHGSSESLSSSVSYSDSVSTTDNVEEYVGDGDPFAGLFKGSAMFLNNDEHMLKYNDGTTQLQRSNTTKKDTTTDDDESNIKNGNNNSQDEQQQQLNVDESTSRQQRIKKYLKRRNESQGQHSIDTLALNLNSTSNSYCPSAESSILSPFNEEEAWEKISEIIESFGGGILNDDCYNTSQSNETRLLLGLDFDFDDKDLPLERRKLAKRLHKAGLLHLERILFENGYDNYMFVNGVLDSNEIELMNISAIDSSKLLKFVETLPPTEFKPYVQIETQLNVCQNSIDPATKQGVSTLSNWLLSIDLAEYTECFYKHLYNSIESACGVWDVELQTVLEINKLGHRRRILQSLAYMREKHNQLTNSTGNNTKMLLCETNDVSRKKFTTQKSIQLPNFTQPQRHVSHKSRTAPPPPTTTTTTTKLTEPNTKTPVTPQTLEIRAPSELLLGLPLNLRTKWRHSAIALVNEYIKYEVYYLGSTIVRDLRGTESTRKSIHKLKRDDFIKTTTKITRTTSSIPKTTIENKSLKYKKQKQLPKIYTTNTQNNNRNNNFKNKTEKTVLIQQHQQKSLLVCLAISQSGVEFIDVTKKTNAKQEQRSICVHEIQNINCACQDSDDLSYFAYITKENDCHYCHVFNATNMDLATEIILTLGQAFEVAYQLALRDGSKVINSKAAAENACDYIFVGASD